MKGGFLQYIFFPLCLPFFLLSVLYATKTFLGSIILKYYSILAGCSERKLLAFHPLVLCFLLATPLVLIHGNLEPFICNSLCRTFYIKFFRIHLSLTLLAKPQLVADEEYFNICVVSVFLVIQRV